MNPSIWLSILFFAFIFIECDAVFPHPSSILNKPRPWQFRPRITARVKPENDGHQTLQPVPSVLVRSKSDDKETADEQPPSEAIVNKTRNKFKSESKSERLTGIPKAIALFTLKLFRALQQSNPEDNQIYSPVGIANAFSMLMFGASANSLLEVFRGLGLNESFPTPEAAHVEFKDFYHSLKRSNSNQYYSLDIANLILIQKNVSAIQEFVQNLKKFYDFGFGEVDFVNEPDKVLNDVNSWIAKNTHNKIINFLREPLDRLTKLVILNAVYFNGSWAESFDPKQTNPSMFYNKGTTAVNIPFMTNTGTYGVYEDTEKKFTLIELKYKGDVSFFILLPTEKDGLSSILKHLRGRDIFHAVADKHIELSLPKFKLSAKYDLKKVLPQLGIKAIFTPGADFSTISGDRSLSVSSGIHQSVIEVNEQGTIATAVTSIVIGSRSSRVPVIHVNRPFVFYIRNTKNKLIYFMGKVNSL